MTAVFERLLTVLQQIGTATASPVLQPARRSTDARISLCCQGILADLNPLPQRFTRPPAALRVLRHCDALLRRRSHLHANIQTAHTQ